MLVKENGHSAGALYLLVEFDLSHSSCLGRIYTLSHFQNLVPLSKNSIVIPSFSMNDIVVWISSKIADSERLNVPQITP